MIIPRTTVSIVGATQPPILRDALGEEHKQNGFLARMLTAHPPSRPRSWAAAKKSRPTQPARAYDRMVGSLLNLQFTRDKDDREIPVELHLSDAADVLFGEFFEAFDPDRLGIIDPDLRWVYAKLLGSAPRMALVFHEVKVASGEIGDSDEVDAETIQAGITLSRWFAHEQERVYRIMREPPEASERRRLVDWIREQADDGSITVRALQRKLHRHFPTAEDARAALEGIRTAGLGDWDRSAGAGSTGRPSEVFRLLELGGEAAESAVPVDKTPAQDSAREVLSPSPGKAAQKENSPGRRFDPGQAPRGVIEP